jgi:hypothetical protein
VLEVNPGVFVETEIAVQRLLAGVFTLDVDGQGPGSIPPRYDLGAPDDPAPTAGHAMPAEGLTARKRQIEIERSEHGKRAAHAIHSVKIYTIRATNARFPLTLRENKWDDRETPYESTIHRARTAGRGIPGGRVRIPDTTRVHVLASLPTGAVRLTPERWRASRCAPDIPDSIRDRTGPIHDLRVRLVLGNVLVFRKGGEFAALLPIDRVPGSPDSLRYFYYVEKPSLFWIFAGARTKGIRTVAAGDSMQFNSFRLIWGRDGEGLGWIYFPDTRVNQHLRFSVVSGQSVDEADPKDTKYWVELGAESEAGF